MRPDVGRSGEEEYLAVPAEIGKRLELEEGNPAGRQTHTSKEDIVS